MKFALPYFLLSLLTLILCTLFLSPTAHGSFAYSASGMQANQQAKSQLRVNSSKQAAQIAKGRFGGKVLKVQKQNSGYRVKLIKNDGNIISVYVDAKSGQISGGH